MFFVPDNTAVCGFYECDRCQNRFLSLQTGAKNACPECEKDIDYEIGPDENIEDLFETAHLIKIIEGEEEVAKYDGLLSLAITGGDDDWLF